MCYTCNATMRFRFLIFCIFSALLPTLVHAASIGFASSGISFSKEPAFSGTPIKVYSVVVNNQYFRLNASVAFLDNNQEFGRVSVDVLMEEARQVQSNWTPTVGQHVVVAKFVSAVAFDAQGNAHPLSPVELEAVAATVSRTITIDSDSDKDGIGDQDEIRTYHTGPLTRDSDGDGLSDSDEIFKYKTDPNKADTDGDGMNDGDEIRVGRNPLVPDAPPPPVPAPMPPAPKKNEPIFDLSPQPSKKPSIKKQNPTPVSATAPIAPQLVTTTTTPVTSTFETVPVPPDRDPDTTKKWIVVLGVVAGLLAIAAAVSAALARRERTRY